MAKKAVVNKVDAGAGQMCVLHGQQLGDLEQSVAGMQAVLSDVKENADASVRTLRGFNGDRGLLGKIDLMENQLTAMTDTVSKVPDIDTKLDRLTENVDTILKNQADTSVLIKRMDAVEKMVKENPTYIWLLKHKTKQTIAYTLFAISFLIIFIGPWLSPDVLLALLTFFGVPADIISKLGG